MLLSALTGLGVGVLPHSKVLDHGVFPHSTSLDAGALPHSTGLDWCPPSS